MRHMKQYIANMPFDSVPATDLADWALSHGIAALTTEEAAHLIGVPSNQVPQRMMALRRKDRIVSPARGLWVPVPPEYRTWGAPNPTVYIDEMMAYMGCDYLVGWLASAALLGAAHHAPQVFQVAVSRNVRARTVGRSRLEFLTRSDVAKMTQAAPSPARSKAKVASAGTTMLMVAEDVAVAGGIGNVANIAIELAEAQPAYIDGLMADAPLFSDAASRRLGWILDTFAGGAPEALARRCAALAGSPSFLSPSDGRRGRLSSRWNLIVNAEVEPDV